MRRIKAGKAMTINEVVNAIDQYYKDHPDQLETPVDGSDMECRGQTLSKDGHRWPPTEVNVKSGVMGFQNDRRRPGGDPRPSRLWWGGVFCSIFVNHKKGSGRLITSLSLQIIRRKR